MDSSVRSTSGPLWRLAKCLALCVALGAGFATTAEAQRALPAGLCRLLADPRDIVTFWPPPPSTGQEFVTADVTYVNFSSAQQAAFQYAVNIWKREVASAIPLEIRAEMKVLEAGVLAEGGATSLTHVSSSLVVYLVAAANMHRGEELLTGAQIVANFSTAVNWYYGTDGQPGPGQYDFVTAALHQLGHGLGFHGSMRSNGTTASKTHIVPFSGRAHEVWDLLAENGAGVALSSFPDSDSIELHAQLTGQVGGVFWRGAVAMAQNAGAKPKLHSPATFILGSSFIHLDEHVYPASTSNSLMTPMLRPREAIHNPGPIARGMLSDIGWSTSAQCGYSVAQPAPVFATGGAASISLATTAGCSWTATSDTSWITITSASRTGSGNVTFDVQPNTGHARTGTLTAGGRLIRIDQATSFPILALTPATLRLAATNAGGGALISKTESQVVTVTQSGAGTVTWTVTSDVPWLQISSGTGTGSGQFTATLVNAPSLPVDGTVVGHITVNAPAADSNPQVNVSLQLFPPSTTSPPFGQVDTPLQNASGVQGAIGVTGWALDDVGVASVKIYRNCLSFDPVGICQLINGHNMVFIGDAAFVPGARPDLECCFIQPQAHRAGWGYLLLTTMLPDVTSGLGYGGQGSLTIYAVATDMEGNRQLLGRAYSGTQATTPTYITMDNATIAKPFGAIDTPGQGQTASGTVANFGWVLTPDSNSSADAGDILLPTDGSTIRVVIDGASVGTVTYNQCRGSVGNPVPPGLYCDDDVANIFGNPTPQPTFTNRIANPTVHRNLDAGRSAIGSFDIDTTTLSNGRHSIAWGVTDSAGRAEGIGSREFIVLNGGALRAGSALAHALADAAAMPVGRASSLTSRAVSDATVWGRIGFDFTRSLEDVAADSTGTRQIRLPELERLELWVGETITAGYLQVGDQLRPLPPGSQLDVTTGVFTWAPLVGYIGRYDLVFVSDQTQLPVTVTIVPKTQPTVGQIRGHIDAPQANTTMPRSFTVGGWALDLAAWQGSGVGAVHVWARRLDRPGGMSQFLGAAEVGIARPDVAAAFGPGGARAGWHLPATLDPGRYEVIAYFWSTRTARFEDARAAAVIVR